jgi:hypothetical protein
MSANAEVVTHRDQNLLARSFGPLAERNGQLVDGGAGVLSHSGLANSNGANECAPTQAGVSS